MKKHEIISKLRTNWTYEFFLELISSYEKNAATPKNLGLTQTDKL